MTLLRECVEASLRLDSQGPAACQLSVPASIPRRTCRGGRNPPQDKRLPNPWAVSYPGRLLDRSPELPRRNQPSVMRLRIPSSTFGDPSPWLDGTTRGDSVSMMSARFRAQSSAASRCRPEESVHLREREMLGFTGFERYDDRMAVGGYDSCCRHSSLQYALRGRYVYLHTSCAGWAVFDDKRRIKRISNVAWGQDAWTTKILERPELCPQLQVRAKAQGVGQLVGQSTRWDLTSARRCRRRLPLRLGSACDDARALIHSLVRYLLAE